MDRLNKNTEGFSHVELLTVLLVLAVTCTAGIMVYSREHRPTTTSSDKLASTNSPNTAQPITIAKRDTSTQVMSKVQQSLAKRLTILTGSQMPTKVGAINVVVEDDTPGAPGLPVAGYNYYVRPSGPSLAITSYANSSSAPSSDIPLIQEILKQEFGSLSPGTVYFDSQPYSAFQNNVAVCDYNANENPIEVDCADKSTYAPTAATMKPLADAFIAANPSKYENEFSDPRISNSKTPGYMFATMDTNASVGFFYQKGGSWHLYEDNQTGLSCDFTTSAYPDSNGNDARLAFLGQPCSSDSIGSPDSTVQ